MTVAANGETTAAAGTVEIARLDGTVRDGDKPQSRRAICRLLGSSGSGIRTARLANSPRPNAGRSPNRYPEARVQTV